ncbi:MAG: DUF481 domain-containing protein [Pseudomonadota bacterium]
MFRHVLILALALSLPPLAWAQAPSEPLARMIDKAAVREKGKYLVPTLMMAIETAPEQAAMLAERAIMAAPAKEKAILKALAAGKVEVRFGDGATPKDRLATVAAREAARPKPGFFAAESWDGEVTLGGSLLTGNTKEKAVTAGVKLDRAVGRREHRFAATGDYSTNEGVTTKERLLASYSTKWFVGTRGYVFGLIDFELDTFSEFDWRLSEAGGLGYRLIERDGLGWDLEGGPGARQTRLEDNGTGTEFIFVGRSDLLWTVNENLKFTNKTTAFFGSTRITLTNDAGFTASLTERLAGRLSFYIKHDSAVPPGQVKTDTATRASLVYGF